MKTYYFETENKKFEVIVKSVDFPWREQEKQMRGSTLVIEGKNKAGQKIEENKQIPQASTPYGKTRRFALGREDMAILNQGFEAQEFINAGMAMSIRPDGMGNLVLEAADNYLYDITIIKK